MSATNHTTNYELPIFVGTDKPAWLVDWNGAMTAIDAAIHTAEGKADQAGTDIGGIESSITTINSTLTSINNAVSQLRIDTNANTGSINTITSLIGNGEPTTTDKTIIGAINEINADMQAHSFDLGSSNLCTITPVIGTVSATSEVRTLINEDKTLGKVYGYLDVQNFTSSVGDYVLATFSGTNFPARSAQFDILVGGSTAYTSGGVAGAIKTKLRFKTNGDIDLVFTSSGSYTYTSVIVSIPPCLLMIEDFGD